MIGNFTLALPCIVDGNKHCLSFDIKIEGGVNFRKMAKLSRKNKKARKLFKEMAKECDKANKDVIKKHMTPVKVTERTCKLLCKLTELMKSSGVTECRLLPNNILKILNLLTILKKENLAQIFSKQNFKGVLDFRNLLM